MARQLAPGEIPTGRRQPDVPQRDHDKFEQLAQAGRLPFTTPHQRELLKKSIGVIQGVPAARRAAVDHGYIHPYVAPPSGMRWGM